MAIVLKDVEVNGLSSQHERADLDPAEAVPALVKLSQTLGMWKHQHGRRLKVLLLPEQVASRVKSTKFSCKFRYSRARAEQHVEPTQDRNLSIPMAPQVAS